MEPRTPEIRFTSFLGLAVCLGLVTGLVEAALVYVFQHYYWIHQDLTCLGDSAELFWICPAFDICLFSLLGVLAGGAARFFPPCALPGGCCGSWSPWRCSTGLW